MTDDVNTQLFGTSREASRPYRERRLESRRPRRLDLRGHGEDVNPELTGPERVCDGCGRYTRQHFGGLCRSCIESVVKPDEDEAIESAALARHMEREARWQDGWEPK